MIQKRLLTISIALLLCLPWAGSAQVAHKAITIAPGETTTIEAEDYDDGGRGTAYQARQNNYICPTGDKFPILAWYSLVWPYLTKEKYEEMAECGFNLAFSHHWDASTIKILLDACRGTGVKQVISGDLAEQFKDDEMVAAWYLKDEPRYTEYPELRAYKDRVRAIDNTRQIYMNLNPTYVPVEYLSGKTYSQYVQQYADTIGLGIISYDHYPIRESKGNVTLRSDYFSNLRQVSDICRATNQPMWAFCLTISHYSYPVPEKYQIRFQVFSDLAYGAQCIQYFTYFVPGGGTGIWEGSVAPLNLDGTRSSVWSLVQDMNKEIQKLAPVFLGAKVVNVGHIGSSRPAGTAEFKKRPACFKSINASGPGFLVSHLKNGDNEYLMIVNHSIASKQAISIARDETLPYKVRRVLSTGELSDNVARSYTVNVGDYLLFQWNVNENKNN
ncbi:MAG: hypothetical protein ILA34_00185 [Bacteroidaceae bacterium]|nr:hypothetical protein [Bacteroidaceae bacterium]